MKISLKFTVKLLYFIILRAQIKPLILIIHFSCNMRFIAFPLLISLTVQKSYGQLHQGYGIQHQQSMQKKNYSPFPINTFLKKSFKLNK